MDIDHVGGQDIERSVHAPRHAFCAALEAGDARGASAAYAEHAVLLAPTAEPLLGRREIEAFWRAGLAAGMVSIELEGQLVQVDRRLAYEMGRYRLRMAPDEGPPVSDRGTYLHVYARQQDGGWLRVAECLHPEQRAHNLPLPRSCNAPEPPCDGARSGAAAVDIGGARHPDHIREGGQR